MPHLYPSTCAQGERTARQQVPGPGLLGACPRCSLRRETELQPESPAVMARRQGISHSFPEGSTASTKHGAMGKPRHVDSEDPEGTLRSDGGGGGGAQEVLSSGLCRSDSPRGDSEDLGDPLPEAADTSPAVGQTGLAPGTASATCAPLYGDLHSPGHRQTWSPGLVDDRDANVVCFHQVNRFICSQAHKLSPRPTLGHWRC